VRNHSREYYILRSPISVDRIEKFDPIHQSILVILIVLSRTCKISGNFSLNSILKSYITTCVKLRSEAIDEKRVNVSYRPLADESSVNFF